MFNLIISALVVILGSLLFLSHNNINGIENIASTATAMANTQPDAQQAAAKAKADALALKPNDPFNYKVDARRFDQAMSNIATREKWQNSKDEIVLVKPRSKSMRPYYVDKYEAMISNHRAWSVPGHFPTDKLRPRDAHTACEAAGKKLCTLKQWQTACRGGRTQPLKFSKPSLMMKVCDFARSNTYDRNDYINSTDSHPKCKSPGLDVFHMIGNLAEFVQDERGQTMAVGLTYYDGKMQNKDTALRQACERIVFGPGQYPPERFNKGLGFRCCKDAK